MLIVDGRVTLLKSLQLKKAIYSILVTPSGITTVRGFDHEIISPEIVVSSFGQGFGNEIRLVP
jgi:hypothetical protein